MYRAAVGHWAVRYPPRRLASAASAGPAASGMRTPLRRRYALRPYRRMRMFLWPGAYGRICMGCDICMLVVEF